MSLSLRFSSCVGLLVGIMLSIGCSADVLSDGPDADTSVDQVLLSVEQTTEGEDVVAPKASASAWFLRLADSSDFDVASHLLTNTGSIPGQGTCQWVNESSARTAGQLQPVELAPAGDVTLRTGNQELPLSVRAFPNVADLLSGVVYTLRERHVALTSPLTLQATGTAVMASWSLQLDVPPTPSGIHLRGDAKNWELVWEKGELSDRIYVDLEMGANGRKLRCAWADGGKGTIAKSVFSEALPERASIHRVRDVVVAENGRSGLAHFDVSRTVALKAEP